MIKSFRGDHAFLSNFYSCLITYEGLQFGSVEAAYQAQKTTDLILRERFTQYDSRKAKREGKLLTLRSDWKKIKLQVMYDLLLIKFSDPVLQKKLLDTGNTPLVEGNTWHDNFWGVCECSECGGVGENWEGRQLMQVRLHYECLG